MADAKKTPLYDEHIRLGAKMVEFAGWMMPLQYENITSEVKAVRECVGVFDVSHMGEILVEGPDTLKFIDKLITNDFSSLKCDHAIYTVMCNEKGGILDDLLVYKFSKEKALLVVNAANVEKDYNWILNHSKNYNVSVKNVSDDFVLIAFQGPKSQELLQKFASIRLEKLEYYQFAEIRIRGVKVYISRTGYTGEDGFEIFTKPEAGVTLWRTLLELAGKYGGKPAGLGARDICRLEASYMLYGEDMDENTSPLEVGLSWVVKFYKEDFIGKDALLKQREKGPERKIVGLVLKEKSVARHGYKVFKDKEEIGNITSGNYSPTLEKSIALAIVKSESVKKGDEVEVEIREKKVKAEVVSLPFYKGSVKSRKKIEEV